MPNYQEFRKGAGLKIDRNLKCGFPAHNRGFNELDIMDDVLTKVPHLGARGTRTLDIGSGCSSLTCELMERHILRGGELVLLDSPEMLASLPVRNASITYLTGRFPDIRPLGEFHTILIYSVVHCLDSDQDFGEFILSASQYLAEGGRMLVGDIPIKEKRERFLASSYGSAFDQEYREKARNSQVIDLGDGGLGAIPEPQLISLLAQLRQNGFEAFLMPQAERLPFSFTREDLLITRF